MFSVSIIVCPLLEIEYSTFGGTIRDYFDILHLPFSFIAIYFNERFI